jgi:hypothetical protein
MFGPSGNGHVGDVGWVNFPGYILKTICTHWHALIQQIVNAGPNVNEVFTAHTAGAPGHFTLTRKNAQDIDVTGNNNGASLLATTGRQAIVCVTRSLISIFPEFPTVEHRL